MACYEEKTFVREEREVGGSERHYGWGEQNLSSVLKVPQALPGGYGDGFTPLYVDDVRTSQEAQASIVCYGNIFTSFLTTL
jgi:hypothetical protein